MERRIRMRYETESRTGQRLEREKSVNEENPGRGGEGGGMEGKRREMSGELKVFHVIGSCLSN